MKTIFRNFKGDYNLIDRSATVTSMGKLEHDLQAILDSKYYDVPKCDRETVTVSEIIIAYDPNNAPDEHYPYEVTVVFQDGHDEVVGYLDGMLYDPDTSLDESFPDEDLFYWLVKNKFYQQALVDTKSGGVLLWHFIGVGSRADIGNGIPDADMIISVYKHLDYDDIEKLRKTANELVI